VAISLPRLLKPMDSEFAGVSAIRFGGDVTLFNQRPGKAFV
jgi:hypothetical protein